MKRFVRNVAAACVLTAACSFFGLSQVVSPAMAGNGKIVVELFTSQGCSSCPPADAFLGELAERDDVIALSFHVDYWNYIGWDDQFSLTESTTRQRDYGRRLGKAYVYTPQIVVDGRAEAVGSNRNAVDNLIKMARAAQKVDIEVEHGADGTARIRLPAGNTVPADVWIGFYDADHSTDVEAGENRGVTVSNANVVRSFKRIARWTGIQLDETVDLAALGAKGRDGCVIIVQAARGGPVLAAAAFPLTKN